MKSFILLLLLLIYFSPCLLAQDIKGKVIDAAQVAIPNASVRLRLGSNNLILDFKRSNSNGEFSLRMDAAYSLDELQLEVSHLGYKRAVIRLVKEQQIYEVLMHPAERSIDEIIVKNKPKVSQLNDTINFHVKGFARDEDRSIVDVLKRMPGIAVDDDGQVRFNNKAIANFYIDNDDVLGAKYGIGTKAIPLGMVENVQVYSNHEHVKALRDQFGTDKVAINLEVSEDAKLKLMGQAKIAAGIAKRYDPEANAILLNKRYKMLNAIKANNVGDELAGEHKNLTATADLQPKDILSASMISTPYIQKKRYFDNHSASINGNNFFKFKKELNLRTVLGYVMDHSAFAFRGDNRYFLANDTISFREQQDADSRSQRGMVELNLERNLTAFFLKNSLILNLNSGRLRADIADNIRYFDQRLSSNNFSIANVFNYITTDRLQNKWELEWKHLTANAPQNLSLGLAMDNFERTAIRDRTVQGVDVFRLTNVVTSRYRLIKGDFKQLYAFTVLQDYKSLASNLDNPSADAFMPMAISIENALNWNEFGGIAQAAYTFRKGKSDFSLQLPFRGAMIYFRDKFSSLDKHRALLFFEPSFSVKHRVNAQDEIVLNYRHKNTINDISSLYSRLILVNYRTLMQHTNVDIWRERDDLLSLDYGIKRPMAMFFANIAVSYSLRNRESLRDMTFNADNMLEVSQIFLANTVHSFNTNIAVSKYVFLLGATFSLKPTYSQMWYKNLLIQELYNVHAYSSGLTADLDFQLFKKINLAYKLKLNHFKNSFWLLDTKGKRQTSNMQYQHSLKTTYSPRSFLHLDFMLQSYDVLQNDGPDFALYFLDFSARLKVKDWKTDIALIGRNLANQRNLSTYNLEHTGEFRNSYALNPRMVMLSATFTF